MARQSSRAPAGALREAKLGLRWILRISRGWNLNAKASTVASMIATMSAVDTGGLKARVRRRLGADGGGRVGYDARANAIKGRVPG
jgi:hypothetical protein